VPVGEERLERAIEQGASWRGSWDGCRSSPTGRTREGRPVAADRVAGLPDVRRPRGRWSTFQYLVRERLRAEGATSSATAIGGEALRRRLVTSAARRSRQTRALVRGAHGRQGSGSIGRVGREVPDADCARPLHGGKRALGTSRLRRRRPVYARRSRARARVEAKKSSCGSCRPTAAGRRRGRGRAARHGARRARRPPSIRGTPRRRAHRCRSPRRRRR
jgi:hypothetical protein